MFAKQDERDDERFAALAADTVQRQAAIVRLAKTRNYIGWCAMFLTAINVISIFFGEKMSGTNAFGNAVSWMITLKFDSDVKLLKAIDVLCARNKLPASDTKDAPKETPNAELPTGAGLS